MRLALVPVLVIACGFPAMLPAQVTSIVARGDTIRFSESRRGGWEVYEVHGVADGGLIVSAPAGLVTVPFASMERLDIRRQHQFDGRRALIAGGIGAATGAVMALQADGQGAEVLVLAGVGALAGAPIGGGGQKAMRSGRTGMLIGGVAVGLLAAATTESCAEGAIVCFGPGASFLLGAGLGGFAGGTVGAWIGALTPGGYWERLPRDRLTIAAAPSRHGMVLSVTLVP